MFIDNIFNKKSHGTHRVPWLTLAISAILMGLYFGGTRVFDLFVFDKTAILNGEVWRFMTGHFVHCNFEHFFWDMTAFMIIGTVIEINNPRHLLPSFFVSCLFISAWLFWGELNLSSYCGLSGALNGMFVLAAVLQWQTTKEKMYLAALVLTALKIAFEFTQHQTVFTNLAAQAVPSAHAAGFLIGLIYFEWTNRKKFLTLNI